MEVATVLNDHITRLSINLADSGVCRKFPRGANFRRNRVTSQINFRRTILVGSGEMPPGKFCKTTPKDTQITPKNTHSVYNLFFLGSEGGPWHSAPPPYASACRPSFSKIDYTDCTSSTRRAKWRVQIRGRCSSVSLLPHEHKRWVRLFTFRTLWLKGSLQRNDVYCTVGITAMKMPAVRFEQ